MSVAVSGLALDPDSVQVSDLSFIEGHWVADLGGDQLEEIWSAPTGDSLVGMFRWIKNGRVWIYELLTIRREADGIVFRFRHFSNELVPWEPKDAPLTFKLVSFSEGKAVFENPEHETRRYSFIKDGEKGLRVHLQAFEDGKLTPGDVFEYHRK